MTTVEFEPGQVAQIGKWGIHDFNDLDNGWNLGGVKYAYDEVYRDVVAWMKEQVPAIAFERYFTPRDVNFRTVTMIVWTGVDGRNLALQASGLVSGDKFASSGVMRAQLLQFFTGQTGPVQVVYPGYDIRQQAQKPSPIGEPVPDRKDTWWVANGYEAQFPHTDPATMKPLYRLMQDGKPWWFQVVYVTVRTGGFGGSVRKAFWRMGPANLAV